MLELFTAASTTGLIDAVVLSVKDKQGIIEALEREEDSVYFCGKQEVDLEDGVYGIPKIKSIISVLKKGKGSIKKNKFIVREKRANLSVTLMNAEEVPTKVSIEEEEKEQMLEHNNIVVKLTKELVKDILGYVSLAKSENISFLVQNKKLIATGNDMESSFAFMIQDEDTENAELMTISAPMFKKVTSALDWDKDNRMYLGKREGTAEEPVYFPAIIKTEDMGFMWAITAKQEKEA